MATKEAVKHTPGSWGIELDTSEDGILITSNATDMFIAQVYREGGLPLEANARLIAAAPELLEACKAMVSCEYGTNAALKAGRLCRAAIAKAEGR